MKVGDLVIHIYSKRIGVVFKVWLNYCWVHFVEYFEGGSQDIHNHKHNEDYSFVLYLNTCSDGETYFNVDPPVSISPNKNNMILFSSNIDHGAKTCYNKQVLVGGLRRDS